MSKPGGDMEPWTSLTRVAFLGGVERLRALLASGVDANARDGSGLTALMYGVKKTSGHCLNRLIAPGTWS